ISNYFMAYLISMDEVMRYVHEGIPAHAGTFAALLVFSSIFFFVYYWFREQVCIVVCPYGRLQGVLLDKNSIVVAYDYVRGEPRGKISSEHGDCIDCKACVRVCPTGIDIRNGTQLECINCTACIDACDEIMDNIGKPRELIRYASENNIAKKEKLRFTSRIKAYSVVLLLIVSALITMLATRDDVDVTILRTQGMIYQSLPDGYIGNLYSARMFNKTHKDIPVQLEIPKEEGTLEIIGRQPVVAKESYAVVTFLIKRKSNEIKKRKIDIHLTIRGNNQEISNKKTTFIGPLAG
ncbi:MAG: cytochrome c oxidase accessory protein CcoG, partial [Bacteroidota bacterium]